MILVEVNGSGVVTCVVTDVVSKQVHRLSLPAPPNRPFVFLMTSLRPETRYIVSFEGVSNGYERTGVFSTILASPPAFNIVVVNDDNPKEMQPSDANLWDWLKIKLRPAWNRCIDIPPVFEPHLGTYIYIHGYIHIQYDIITNPIHTHMLPLIYTYIYIYMIIMCIYRS